MNEIKKMEFVEKKNPNEIIKEIVDESFETKRGYRIHKKELESYVANYYYNETRREIKCSKDELYKLMNDKYGNNEKGYWKNLSFKYFD